jgi:hypothetical protein
MRGVLNRKTHRFLFYALRYGNGNLQMRYFKIQKS